VAKEYATYRPGKEADRGGAERGQYPGYRIDVRREKQCWEDQGRRRQVDKEIVPFNSAGCAGRH
jgi:hypothetical protein